MCSFTVKPDGNFGSPTKTVLNSPLPVVKYCYICKRTVWTKIKHYPTLKTRVLALGLSFCLLCWLPFLFNWKSELDHHCTFCDCYLGTYDPTFQHSNIEVLLHPLSIETIDEKKQPQKKYREVGRRCGDYPDTTSQRDEIMKVYSDALH